MRLAGGLLVPCATLRALAERSGVLEAELAGFVFEPRVRNGGKIRLDFRRRPSAGDLALCEVEGVADLRRVLRADPDGFVTAIDPYLPGREFLPAGRVHATLVDSARASGLLFPLSSRLAAVRYWARRILEAPDFGDDAGPSIRKKYRARVEGYSGLIDFGAGEEVLGHLCRNVPTGGSILVGGSGAGGEVIHLARAGWHVSGIDFLPEMVEAARRNVAAAGVEAEVLEGDLCALDLGRVFDGIYLTPLVYSFIGPGSRRVEALRRLGSHLTPGGSLLFSVALRVERLKFVQAAAARLLGKTRELGDWYTWFLQPDGSIEKSFLHLFAPSGVVRETRRAGFGACRRWNAYFAASGFRPAAASIAGQNGASRRKRR